MNAELQQTGEKVLTVSQFNNISRAVLENEPLLRGVAVRGEISGFRRYPSGHLYFTIKDEGSALSCVMFQSYAVSLRFLPADWMQVRVYGAATVYLKDGRYQFMVRRMVPDGVGGLWAAFEKLKEKLALEGLFDPERKKEIPFFPRRIGVITSIAGAALHDILSVTGRRFPTAEILVHPSSVQGEDAPGQLCAAVRWFSERKNVDVLIIGRGGGSMEDLWAFNDEGLARALAACPVPTVSAVGHETDYTICDFVCDRRAPTPSAAAEIVTPDRQELLSEIADAEDRLSRAALDALLDRRDSLRRLSENPVLRDPRAAIALKKRFFEGNAARFGTLCERFLERKRAAIEKQSAKMVTLNPLAVLARGYGAVFDENGEVVRSVKGLNKGDRLSVRLADGRAETVVEKIEEKEP